MEVTITIDDVRSKSKLNINQTINFTKKSFFYTFLGFTQSHAGVLGDIEGFIQKIPGTYRIEKPFNLTEIDKNAAKMQLH